MRSVTQPRYGTQSQSIGNRKRTQRCSSRSVMDSDLSVFRSYCQKTAVVAKRCCRRETPARLDFSIGQRIGRQQFVRRRFAAKGAMKCRVQRSSVQLHSGSSHNGQGCSFGKSGWPKGHLMNH
eukprot:scaffold1959_cov162-Amphora_coffeaeformis.AAC.10